LAKNTSGSLAAPHTYHNKQTDNRNIVVKNKTMLKWQKSDIIWPVFT